MNEENTHAFKRAMHFTRIMQVNHKRPDHNQPPPPNIDIFDHPPYMLVKFLDPSL